MVKAQERGLQTARLRPIAFIAVLLLLWQFAIAQPNHLLPSPVQVAAGLWELLRSGLLVKYVVASLFRVTWGFLLAGALAIPLGLAAGWSRTGDMALNPLAQVFRPISPLAWIPLAILWFGVGDLSSVFLIFIGCFCPLLVATMTAVRSVPAIYVHAGRNFGLSSAELLRQVVFPAILPELIIALRVTLGVAWLVVVAAEMIAVNSGLGFLIVDARNAGNRYDLVVAGMVVIAIIGLVLNFAMQSLERVNSVRWGYFGDSGE